MADRALLAEQLSVPEMVALGNLMHHPGYKVLEKLIRAAVDSANVAVIKVDPKDPNYNRILAAAQQEARAMNTFALRVLQSVASHAQVGVVQAETEEAKQLRIVRETIASTKS